MPSRVPILSLAASVALLAVCGGCPQPSPSPTQPPITSQPASSAALKLLVVDDAPLGEAIARQWKSRTEATVVVQHVGLAEVLSASRLPGDVIVFPAGYVGHLVERELIVPLDDQALAAGKFDRGEIFDQVRLRDIAWGNRTVAVPLGSPQLLLVYRRDLFEKLALQPPRTWQEYQQVAQRLATEAKDPAGAPLATAEPLADGWAGQLLLARAAAYVTHRDQVSPLFDYATLDPLLTSPPYERALQELVAARHGLPLDQRHTPAQALAALCEGRAAMALTWPAPVRESEKPCELALGFSLLPGSAEVYNFPRRAWEQRVEGDESHVPLLAVSGRVAAVTSTAGNVRAAQTFLAWLGGREASPLVGPASFATTLFRESHLADAPRWTSGLDAAAARSYAQTLQQATSLPRFVSLRLPGRSEYLRALDAAVQAAVAAEKSPAEALAAASEKWKEITAARGLDSQRRALRRDLGLESLP